MRTREGVEPVCPFCRTAFARPAELRLSAVETVQGGICQGCGAIYVLDPTGKNVGEVMVQAIGMAADRLSKQSADMVPDEDYEDIILNYDWRTHRSSGEAKGFLDRSGRLYFVKIKKK